MGTYEIYTVGGGYFLHDILNYLAAFTSSGNFQALVSGGITLGVLVAAFQLVVFGSVRQVMVYIIGVVLASAILVGPKARAVVMDSTVPLGIYGIVDNVPWSVAWVASLTSRTSHALTNYMETLLAPPTSVSYQRTGMLFGSTILSQAARWRAITPVIHEDLVSFMENCMVDGSHLDIVDVGDLGHSGDLMTFIGASVPQSLAYYDSTLRQTTTCADGWPELSQRVNQEASEVLFFKSAVRYPHMNGLDFSAAANQTRATLDGFQTFMGMASAGATQTIQQAMLVNSLDDAIQRQIASSGNDAAMLSYQTARAEAQTSQSYSVVGISALKWVPLLKIVFESIYLAAFPLAVVMMMTPLIWTVMKGYFGGFVWLAAWDPLSAILHSIVLKASSGYYREAMGSYDDGSINYVMSFANNLGIRAVEQDVGSMAGYLMMSIPFLATVIMFGSGRMAGLATSMLNVSQGAAIEAGREGATGNVSLSNLSMNNQAANKVNLSRVYDVGATTTRLGTGAFTTTNPDGSRTYSTGSAQSSGGLSARVGQSIREEVADRRDEAIRDVSTSREEWSTALNETSANYADFGRSLSTGTSTSRDSSTSESRRHIEEARQAHTAVENFAKEHGISLDAAYRVALAAGSPKIKGANIEGSITGTGTDSDTFRKALNAAQESGLSETVAKYGEAVQAIRASDTSSQTDTESGGERWSVEDVQRHGESYAEAQERATSYSNAYNNVYSKGITYDGQMTDAIIDEWRNQGRSDSEIASLLNPKTASQVRAQEQAVDEVLPGLIGALGLNKPVVTTAEQMDALVLHQAPTRRISEYPLPSSGTEHQAGYERVVDASNTVGETIDGRRATLDAATERNHEAARKEVLEGQDFGVVPGAVAKVGSTAMDVVDSAKDGFNYVFGNDNLTHYDRDVMIRTIAGEAGRESEQGQAAVAHVIMNRVTDPRYGDNPAEVALQLKQFSAWNAGTGGNGLPYDIQEGSPEYERIGQIVDQVHSGQIADPTGGATHYYSPAGMAAHVARGEQSNELPKWLQEQNAERSDAPTKIGGHVFTGRVRGER